MKAYIGIKQVKAEPQEKDGEAGYAVKYTNPDGSEYISWSPAEVFELFYTEAQKSESFGSVGPAEISLMDTPGAGGAYHKYAFILNGFPYNTPERIFGFICFQQGPPQKNGINGIFIEDLLNVCAHRLECFQDGAFACEENGEALQSIYEALGHLHRRTMARRIRGVSGTTNK